MRANFELPNRNVDRSKHRLVLRNVRKPSQGKKRWARVGVFVASVGITAATVIFLGLYYKYSEGLPDIPKVDQYWPPIVTEVYTDDAVLAGEFYNERRKVVPYEHIPKRLVQAFIASEDSSFFDHKGVDVLGTGARRLQDDAQEGAAAPAPCRAAPP